MNRDHSVTLEIASKYCISDSFVDHDGYSISSKGFLPTVVDIMVIWVKSTIPVHLPLLIPRMSMFTIAISCLTTSNLPWFMDLTFQVPIQYCLYNIRCCFYHQSHPQLGVVFALAPSLHSFWNYFCTDLSSILGSSSFSILFFAFSYCSWGSQDKNSEVVCHSLLQWHRYTLNGFSSHTF